MSRQTASDIVAAGLYLDPKFDASTLTVNQLMGIFGHHNIRYPTPYTKPKLVQLFKDEITAKASRLGKERLKRQNSIASDDGITDGHTGKPLGQLPARPRRTSRRLSKAPEDSTDDEVIAEPPPKPKRRRASAQPETTTTRAGTKLPVPPSPVIEESEPEDSPARKVIRKGRASNFANDSGWEDNNIFQSGAESSSPVRPSPPKPRSSRKSTGPRRSRKASSAPPEHVTRSSSPPVEVPKTAFQFEPEIPVETRRFTRASSKPPVSPPAPKPLFAVPSVVLEEDEPTSQTSYQPVLEEDDVFGPISATSHMVVKNQVLEEEDEEELATAELAEPDDEDEETPENEAQVDAEEEDVDAAHTRAVSHKIANSGKALVRRQPRGSGRPWYLTVLYLLLAGYAASLGYEYKEQSAALGFCDTGKTTNDLIELRKAEQNAIQECNYQNRTLMYAPEDDDQYTQDDLVRECPPPALLPIPQPTTCTPCPPHASCSRFTVACDNGFILRPHTLLSFLPPPPPTSPSSPAQEPVSTVSDFIWTAISTLLDGLPGLGPIALPPQCVIDQKRTVRIGALGKAIDQYLAQERGRRLCTGEMDDVEVPDSEGGEAFKWGLEIDALKAYFAERTPDSLRPSFEGLFNEAVQGLAGIGGTITGQDADGRVYLARETGEMSWNCALTVKTRDTWRAWRNTVLLTVLGILSSWGLQKRRTVRKIQSNRINELAQIAFDTLRNQELAHHTDPVRATVPYLPADQLRDLVLQEEPSVSARAALWARVSAVVESNANVRANHEETATGDEMRVWRWLGTPGRTTG